MHPENVDGFNQEKSTSGESRKLLTAKSVSELLTVPLVSVYEYARRGVLPSVRIGKLVRFQPSDIDAFVKGGGSK